MCPMSIPPEKQQDIHGTVLVLHIGWLCLRLAVNQRRFD